MASGRLDHYARVKVAVCVKQVPDPATTGRLHPESHTLVRGAPLVLDGADACGVEMALQLVHAAGGGEVVLVSMSPGDETAGVRSALAMGADRAVLVSDDRLAGSDALGTAKVLAAAVARLEADLVLAGTESTDGYTGTVPVQLAELLGMPSVTFARRVEIVDGRLSVERQTEAGFDDVQCPLPAVVTVTAGAVEPRRPTFGAIMASRGRPVEQLTIDGLGLDASAVGWAGSRQQITEVAPAEERAAGDVVDDDGDAHHRIIELLERLKVV